MKAIGFRVEPMRIHWAVVEGPNEPLVLVGHGELTPPKSYSEPKALAWHRTEIKNLLAQFSPERAAVRFPEPMAQRGNVTSTQRRLRIEGVALEVCHGIVSEIVTGPLASVTARLGSASAKAYLKTDELRGLDCYAAHQKRPPLLR